MQSAEIVQALSREINVGKQNRTIVVIMSPIVQIPTELEKMFVVIEHDLPSREQLEEIARGVATEDDELPDGPELQMVLDASVGLTRMEAENAFSLSLAVEVKLRFSFQFTEKTKSDLCTASAQKKRRSIIGSAGRLKRSRGFGLKNLACCSMRAMSANLPRVGTHKSKILWSKSGSASPTWIFASISGTVAIRIGSGRNPLGGWCGFLRARLTLSPKAMTAFAVRTRPCSLPRRRRPDRSRGDKMVTIDHIHDFWMNLAYLVNSRRWRPPF